MHGHQVRIRRQGAQAIFHRILPAVAPRLHLHALAEFLASQYLLQLGQILRACRDEDVGDLRTGHELT